MANFQTNFKSCESECSRASSAYLGIFETVWFDITNLIKSVNFTVWQKLEFQRKRLKKQKDIHSSKTWWNRMYNHALGHHLNRCRCHDTLWITLLVPELLRLAENVLATQRPPWRQCRTWLRLRWKAIVNHHGPYIVWRQCQWPGFSTCSQTHPFHLTYKTLW